MSSPNAEFQSTQDDINKYTAIVTLWTVAIACVIFCFRAWQWDIPLRFFSNINCIFFCSLGALVLMNPASTEKLLTTGLQLNHRPDGKQARKWSLLMALLAMSITAAIGAYTSGGLSTQAANWVLILPLVGGLIGGLKIAYFTIGFSLASCFTLYLLEYYFGQPTDLTPPQFVTSQQQLHQSAQFIVISMVSLSFLRQVKKSQQSLIKNLHQLKAEVNARSLAEASAEQSNRAKSQFLANMSHEIRTPMNGVLGVLNILSRQPLSVDQQKHVNIGLTSSKNLLSLINDILDVSKIEAGKLQIEFINFDILQLLDDVTHHWQNRPDKALMIFRISNPDNIQWVSGDPVRIRQVIDNLLSNAIKFCASKPINISARLEYQHKNYLFQYEVHDAGIGIPANKLDALFEPFTQVEASTTRQFGGTGLGLAISNNLMQLMQGTLNVKSTINVGSTFTLTMPLTTATNQPETLPDAATIQTKITTPQNIKILLVEDNQINVEIALGLLEPHAFEIEIARNGRLAVDQVFNNDSYQLVLMDCQMPVMDGYQATKTIRANPLYKSLPIIAMTANAMLGDREKCLQAGMSDYLSKPIDPDLLDQKLSHWLGNQPMALTPDGPKS
ncbi:MAG: response regulator [Pseudomonadales bacterium]|nr:response regulator [Pseudomonadales bacterium]